MDLDQPEEIPEDAADEIATDAKALIFNKHIHKSFNGLDYEARVSHSNQPFVLKVRKGSIATCSTKECLNYRLSCLCIHSLAITQSIRKVKNIVKHACENAKLINLSFLQLLKDRQGSGQRKFLQENAIGHNFLQRIVGCSFIKHTERHYDQGRTKI